jgi:hypothetical protein
MPHIITEQEVVSATVSLGEKMAVILDGQRAVVVENVLCYFLVAVLKKGGVSREGMQDMLDWHWDEDKNPVDSSVSLPN